MNKILVTGATGCLGSNLVKKLIAEGNSINILIIPKTWHPFLDNLKLNTFYGDIRNQENVRNAMKGCDYVYHLAGIVSYNLIDSKKIYTTHVNGTENILEVAQELGVKKVVVTASTAGIGIPENKDQPLNENSVFDYKKYKRVMYMYSKHLTIELCKKFAKHGLDVSIVSPTTIYGQGDQEMHIGKTVKKIKENKICAPPGGNAVVSVDDIVDAHLLVMEKGRSGENYIFADECMTYIDMFNRIAKLVNAKPITKIIPNWILPPTKLFLDILEKIMFIFGKKPLLSPHSLDIRFKYRYFDSKKALSELGWKPKVNFDESMVKAIKFYEDNKLI